MLKKFEVTNFKNFKHKFIFDLSNTKNYAFNEECIENRIVKKGLIYGPNGCGKTNLGRAIFDITTHLTDHQLPKEYESNYTHASSTAELAEFKYTFSIEGVEATYSYKKSTVKKIAYEKLTINGKKVVELDRRTDGKLFVDLQGAETLNRDLSNNDISAFKFVRNNSVLTENETNNVFYKLFAFVEFMLFERMVNAHRNIKMRPKQLAKIVLNGDGLPEFESFLNKAGVKCKLTTITPEDTPIIAFKFDEKTIEFCTAASTGTLSLAELFVYLQMLKERIDSNLIKPFVFIDEFDAFFHHGAAKIIIQSLKKYDAQILLSTHNTVVMNTELLRPDCYFVMKDIEINPLHALTNKDLRQAHNIEKMYRAGAFHR